MSLHYLAKLLLRKCSTFSKLLMVFVGMSKFGKTDLIFVDPGVMFNGHSFHALTGNTHSEGFKRDWGE